MQCNGQVESVKRIVKKRDMSYPVSKFVLSSHSERSAVMPSISGDGDSPDHLTTVITFLTDGTRINRRHAVAVNGSDDDSQLNATHESGLLQLVRGYLKMHSNYCLIIYLFFVCLLLRLFVWTLS